MNTREPFVPRDFADDVWACHDRGRSADVSWDPTEGFPTKDDPVLFGYVVIAVVAACITAGLAYLMAVT